MGENSFGGMNLGYDSKNVFKYRKENMCNQWNIMEKIIGPCKVQIYRNPYNNLVITGNTNQILNEINKFDNVYVKYWAANKPMYRQSFTGSGLPFPNEKIAFENTDNQGMVQVKNGNFTFNIDCPNSYMTDMGNTYVQPQLKIQFYAKNKSISGIYEINLVNSIPFRDVEYPKLRNFNDGSMFYCNVNLPVRNQEEILRDSAYPKVNREPVNFWGLTPPH